MLEKIAAFIADQLDTVSADEITEATNFKEDLNADSLDLFELAMAIEEEFGVEIPQEDLENVVTVGDAVEFIKNAGIE